MSSDNFDFSFLAKQLAQKRLDQFLESDLLVQITQNPESLTGPIGPPGPCAQRGVAMYTQNQFPHNEFVAEGHAFLINNEIVNNTNGNITITEGNGGTIFTVNNTGLYSVDFELPIRNQGAIGLYKATVAAGLQSATLDTNTNAGSYGDYFRWHDRYGNWVHGRSILVVTEPMYFFLSAADYPFELFYPGRMGNALVRMTIVQL